MLCAFHLTYIVCSHSTLHGVRTGAPIIQTYCSLSGAPTTPWQVCHECCLCYTIQISMPLYPSLPVLMVMEYNIILSSITADHYPARNQSVITFIHVAVMRIDRECACQYWLTHLSFSHTESKLAYTCMTWTNGV
jgi:hypothetical protein